MRGLKGVLGFWEQARNKERDIYSGWIGASSLPKVGLRFTAFLVATFLVGSIPSLKTFF
jgi:hypothetical protein